jgi:hypothetical protein
LAVLGTGPGGIDAEREPDPVGEDGDGAVGVQQHRCGVPGGAPGQGAFPRGPVRGEAFHAGDQGGGEHVLAEGVAGDVDGGEHSRRAGGPVEAGHAQLGAQLAHRDRRCDVVAGHVADDQAGGAGGVEVGVVPVPADQLGVLGRLVAGGQLQVVGLRQQRGQQRPLHGLGHRAIEERCPRGLDHQAGAGHQRAHQLAVALGVGR